MQAFENLDFEKWPVDEAMDTDFEALRNELLRRIGRNLVNFQRLERMLKFLVSTGRLRGPVKELAAISHAQRASAKQSTMGGISTQFVDGFLSDAGEPDESASGPVDEARVSFSVTFGLDADASGKLRDGLTALVAERNELVHQLFDRWDGQSIESTQQMLAHLDAQRERLIPVYERVQGMVASLQESLEWSAQFLASPECQRSLELLWLRQSPLVEALSVCARELARPDGWLALATAGNVIQSLVPAEMSNLKQRYGHATLKRLVLATELFEVRDEPTAKGFRTVYRCKTVDAP